MDYYIGIDIGTTSTKAVAFNIAGEILSKYAIGYKLQHPKPNCSELEPTGVLNAVIDCLYQIGLSLPNDDPVLISFCSFMHSIIAIDKNNNLLTDCIIWADNRASVIAEELNKKEIAKAIYQQTGVPVHAMTPLCKILWLKENEPELYDKTDKYIGIKEFIFYYLFNTYLIDTGIASTTGLLNIHTLKWERSILDLIGIKEEQLSFLVDPGYKLFIQKNTEPKLTAFKNSAFIIGGSDGAFANLGSGAIDPSSMAVTIGTSGAVRMLSQEAYIDKFSRTFCYFVNEKDYIIGGASNNGAVAIQWLKENLLADESLIDILLASAQNVIPGSDGLLFLPYLLGERAPLWNSKAKAIFWGLDITHSKQHLVRAVMEGILYNLYAIAEILFMYKKPSIIYATGGFIQNSLWVQMLSDIFNMEVRIPASEESSALGAVMVGLKALKITSQFKYNFDKIYKPNLSNNKIYLQSFAKFKRINKLIVKEFI